MRILGNIHGKRYQRRACGPRSRRNRGHRQRQLYPAMAGPFRSASDDGNATRILTPARQQGTIFHEDNYPWLRTTSAGLSRVVSPSRASANPTTLTVSMFELRAAASRRARIDFDS